MASLVTCCLVCGHPASLHHHYGAICCYSCRAFFRRSIAQSYDCVSGDRQCEVNKITRNNCRSCRYDKCISVGMRSQAVDVNKKWKKQGKKKQEINNTTDINNKTEVKEVNSIDIVDIVDECFKGAHEDQTKINQLDNSKCAIKKIRSCQDKSIQIVLDEQLNNIRGHNNKTGVNEVNSIDIMDIVDECFKEEHEEQTKITQTSALGNRKCAIKKNESCQDKSVHIVLDEKNHSAVCFTIEEEFQVHDLIAKREFMNDIFAQIKNNVLSTHENDSMVTKTEDGKWQYEKRMMVASQNLGQQFGSAKFQDVFNEFRNVKRNIAYEYYYKSFPALLALFEAISEGTKDLTIAEQFTVLGSSKRLVQSLPNIKGLGLDDMVHYNSPWALSRQDEDFFRQTASQLGNLICPDVSLCSMYHTLIMCSYNMFTREQDKEIKSVQNKTWLLMYRYLASKVGPEEAAKKLSVLEGFIEKLHRCGDIMANRRLDTACEM